MMTDMIGSSQAEEQNLSRDVKRATIVTSTAVEMAEGFLSKCNETGVG